MHTTPAHEELVSLAPAVLTSHHAHHYRGFANTQWRLFGKTAEHGAAAGIDTARVEGDFEALHGVLEAARKASSLPEHPAAFDALDEFVVRRRVG